MRWASRATSQGEVFWGADRHIRRGGRGGEWSGDACVARWGRGKALLGPGRGRRKRPHSTPHPPPPLRGRRRFRSDVIKNLPLKDTSTTPAPMGMKALPKRHDKKPPCERSTPAPTGLPSFPSKNLPL